MIPTCLWGAKESSSALRSGVARSRSALPRGVRPARLGRARRPLTVESLEARTLPSFAPPILHSGPLVAAAAAVGDFNNDARLDLAVAERGIYLSALFVWLGNGDGTLAGRQVAFEDYLDMTDVVAGDFNGDARLDLAVAANDQPKGTSQWVHVLLGRGDGRFALAHSPDPGAIPYSLAVGDFDHDGHPDLAVTLGFSGGSGGGAHAPGAGRRHLPARAPPRPREVREFRGRGQLQRRWPARRGSGVPWPRPTSTPMAGSTWPWRAPRIPLRGAATCACCWATATAPSGVRAPHEAGRNPRAVQVADFNGDGHADLAVVNYADFPLNDGSVGVLLGRGDGTFQSVVHYPTGRFSQSLAVGDFNRDGIPDLAAIYRFSGTNDVVGILLGRGDGTLHDPDPYAVPVGPTAFAVGDFNGDDHPDLAIATASRVGILLNDGIWPNRPVVHFYVYPAAGQVTAGQPFDISVLALNALYGLVPTYTGSIGVFTTDPLGTPPFVYQFRPADQGIAAFPRGLTLRTPGQQLVYVYDTATFQVYGSAVFDVVAAGPGRGGDDAEARPALDLFVGEALIHQTELPTQLPIAAAGLPLAAPRPAVTPGPLASAAFAPTSAEVWPPPLLDRLFAGRYNRAMWDLLIDAPLGARA